MYDIRSRKPYVERDGAASGTGQGRPAGPVPPPVRRGKNADLAFLDSYVIAIIIIIVITTILFLQRIDIIQTFIQHCYCCIYLLQYIIERVAAKDAVLNNLDFFIPEMYSRIG